jgi:hypothetical protein
MAELPIDDFPGVTGELRIPVGSAEFSLDVN